MENYKNPYRTFSNYILRTPAHSIHFYKNLLKKAPISKKDLEAVFKTPLINEAIYLDTPDLHLQLEKWFLGFIDSASEEERIQNGLLKKITKLSSTSSTAGLFISSCLGTFSEQTQIELEPVEYFNRATTLDNNFMAALISILLKNEDLKKQLSFFPSKKLYNNKTLYNSHVTSFYNKKNISKENVQINYINSILRIAKEGKKIFDLSKKLMDSNISLADAEQFVNDLIKKKALISELELILTEEDTLSQLIKILKTKQNTNLIVNKLINIQDELYTINLNLKNTSHIYKRLINELKEIDSSINTNYIFRTNLFTTTKSNTLDYTINNDLKKVIPVLNKLNFCNKNTSLNRFKENFIERYSNNEVPLGIVMDKEMGLGYNPKNLIPKKEWTEIDDLLLEKLVCALNINMHTIQLKDEDFEGFNENWSDLPDTISATIKIIGTNKEQKILLETVKDSKTTNLLARIGGKNKALKKHIKEVTRTKIQPKQTASLRNMIYLPRYKENNLIIEPLLVSHKTNRIQKTYRTISKQIPLTDIMISVKDNCIQLRSKKEGTYIKPELINISNYKNSTVYRFLKDLQSQSCRSNIGYQWNEIFQNQSFLPRLEYKNCILSKARWLINTETIIDLYKDNLTLNSITKWRTSLNLPKCAELILDDETLLINFENITVIKMLLESVKDKTNFILEESLITEDSIVKQNNQSFNNEFIVSFYNETKLSDSALKTFF